MGKMDLINFGIFALTIMSVNPATSSNEGKAITAARDALLQTEYVKSTLKKVEKSAKGIAYEYTGLEDHHWTYIMVGGTLAAGVVSTKPFKNFRYGNNKFYLRPDIEYRFDDGETKGNINFYWEF